MSVRNRIMQGMMLNSRNRLGDNHFSWPVYLSDKASQVKGRAEMLMI